jgi:hypothetical protein
MIMIDPIIKRNAPENTITPKAPPKTNNSSAIKIPTKENIMIRLIPISLSPLVRIVQAGRLRVNKDSSYGIIASNERESKSKKLALSRH